MRILIEYSIKNPNTSGEQMFLFGLLNCVYGELDMTFLSQTFKLALN